MQVSYLKQADRNVQYEKMPQYFEEVNEFVNKREDGKNESIADGIPSPLTSELKGKDLIIEHTKCKKRGDDFCLNEVTWEYNT